MRRLFVRPRPSNSRVLILICRYSLSTSIFVLPKPGNRNGTKFQKSSSSHLTKHELYVTLPTVLGPLEEFKRTWTSIQFSLRLGQKKPRMHGRGGEKSIPDSKLEKILKFYSFVARRQKTTFWKLGTLGYFPFQSQECLIDRGFFSPDFFGQLLLARKPRNYHQNPSFRIGIRVTLPIRFKTPSVWD